MAKRLIRIRSILLAAVLSFDAAIAAAAQLTSFSVGLLSDLGPSIGELSDPEQRKPPPHRHSLTGELSKVDQAVFPWDPGESIGEITDPEQTKPPPDPGAPISELSEVDQLKFPWDPGESIGEIIDPEQTKPPPDPSAPIVELAEVERIQFSSPSDTGVGAASSLGVILYSTGSELFRPLSQSVNGAIDSQSTDVRVSEPALWSLALTAIVVFVLMRRRGSRATR